MRRSVECGAAAATNAKRGAPIASRVIDRMRVIVGSQGYGLHSGA